MPGHRRVGADVADDDRQRVGSIASDDLQILRDQRRDHRRSVGEGGLRRVRADHGRCSQKYDGRRVRRRTPGLGILRIQTEPGDLADRESELDEMTETYMRFLLSLLTFESTATRSQDSLRSYLHRVLVPALGLPSESI